MSVGSRGWVTRSGTRGSSLIPLSWVDQLQKASEMNQKCVRNVSKEEEVCFTSQTELFLVSHVGRMSRHYRSRKSFLMRA